MTQCTAKNRQLLGSAMCRSLQSVCPMIPSHFAALQIGRGIFELSVHVEKFGGGLRRNRELQLRRTSLQMLSDSS